MFLYVGLESAKTRLDAIMSIQEHNTRHQHGLGFEDADCECFTSPDLGSKNTTGANGKSYDDLLEGELFESKDKVMLIHSWCYCCWLCVATDHDFESEERFVQRCSVIGEQIAADCKYSITPRLSFHHPQNVIAWTYVRLIIQNFGERFRFRLDSYVGE